MLSGEAIEAIVRAEGGGRRGQPVLRLWSNLPYWLVVVTSPFVVGSSISITPAAVAPQIVPPFFANRSLRPF